jgi:hypothetical protein
LLSQIKLPVTNSSLWQILRAAHGIASKSMNGKLNHVANALPSFSLIRVRSSCSSTYLTLLIGIYR